MPVIWATTLYFFIWNQQCWEVTLDTKEKHKKIQPAFILISLPKPLQILWYHLEISAVAARTKAIKVCPHGTANCRFQHLPRAPVSSGTRRSVAKLAAKPATGSLGENPSQQLNSHSREKLSPFCVSSNEKGKRNGRRWKAAIHQSKNEPTNAGCAKQSYSKANAQPGLLSLLACPIYSYITPLTYGELLQEY